MRQDLRYYIPTVFFLLLWAYMQYHGKLPKMVSIQNFVSLVNSRGGNIIILGGASYYFFRWSMYLFMRLLSMVKDGSIKEDNAFALMAIQFVTTSAFGGAAGALLKTMTGENSNEITTHNGNRQNSGFEIKQEPLTPDKPVAVVTPEPVQPVPEPAT